MTTNWPQYMSEASDEDVLDYIRNHSLYETDAVEAAIAELANRGTIIPPDKIDLIRDHALKLDRKAQEEAEESSFTESLMSGQLDRNATTSKAAPLFYSRSAISLFTVLFSPLFGAFMLAANIERTQERKGFYVVGAFGILYPILVSLLFREIGMRNVFLVEITYVFGALVLNGYFWPQYIGKSTIYQKRAPIYPIIFGLIVILILVLVAVFLR